MSDSVHATQRTLAEWLSYLEQIHPTTIELGLERTKQVFERLGISFPKSKVVTVAGTNGKGTTCRAVEALALAQGLKVGVYSSPHLMDYRERVRVNDTLLPETSHVSAFERVEACRQDISLTYFEFGTLAALLLLAEAELDLIILEVGLGGRLDAVNIVEPDISVITTIDLDHQDWLGNTRELVAKEKAGILRANKPAIIGDLDPPITLIAEVERLHCDAVFQNRDFGYRETNANVFIWQQVKEGVKLPESQFPVQNMATAVATARALGWHVDQALLDNGLRDISLPGRCQLLQTRPDVLVDVAHNPQATNYLISRIKQRQFTQLHLVCGMLSDKDSRASLHPFTPLSAKWYLGEVNSPRSASNEVLKSCLADEQDVVTSKTVSEAFAIALNNAAPDDLIVVFGSFFTVSEVFAFLNQQQENKREH